ncbi:MAG: phosphodiester glycosidase family protein [Bacillota bacterium]
MKYWLYIFLVFAGLLGFASGRAQAAGIAENLSGRIVLSVQEHGEAWYINPVDLRRYFLGRPSDAFGVMRELGLGISEQQFQEIAQAGLPVEGNKELAAKLSGKILLQVEKNGEAWYVNPVDLKKYYLGRPDDAFRIMRELGLGITREDLARIHKPGLSESLDQFSSYDLKTISTERGDFKADVMKISLKDPDLKIMTITASGADCKDGPCPAGTLGSFVFDNNSFAGVNGSYFCSGNGCGAANYFFFPIYDSRTGVMVNQDQLKYWTTGPLIVFDADNRFYYFKDSREFKSVADFESTYGTRIQAAIGNKPRLVEKGMNALIDWELDKSQRTGKYWRNAIGYMEDPLDPGKGDLYIVIARAATVDDLAVVMKSMNMDYALNLDGGSSSALIYNGEYMVGPGRNIPNVLVFKH